MIVNIHPIPKALPYMEQMLPHSRHPLTNAQLRRGWDVAIAGEPLGREMGCSYGL